VRGRRARRAVAALAAAAAAASVGACEDEPAEPAGLAASNMQTASCRDWRKASPQDRQATVDRLEEIVAGPRDEGVTLPDDVAYDTLEGRCEPEFARGFLLYELYIRAAAFQSLAE
jgi:hypothetical protein